MRFWRAIAVCACVLNAGCKEDPLTKALNASFPPIDRTEQALAAVDTSRSNVRKVKGQNIAINLRADDIRLLAEKALTEKLPQISQAKLSFDRQRIGIEGNFDSKSVRWAS